MASYTWFGRIFFILLLASRRRIILSELTGTEVSINPIWGIPVLPVSLSSLLAPLFERVFLKADARWA